MLNFRLYFISIYYFWLINFSLNARKAVYVAQSDEQKVFGGMLDSEFERRTVFRVVKQMVGKNRDIVGAGCVKGSDRKLVTGEAEVKDRWKAYFVKC